MLGFELYRVLLVESAVLCLASCNPLFPIDLPTKCPSPPCVCSGGNANTNNNANNGGVYTFGRKSVQCVSDRLNQIPIDKMDPDTEVCSFSTLNFSIYLLNLLNLFDLFLFN